MNESFLPYGRQDISEEDIKEVVRVLRSDWLTTGPEVNAFEERLAEYCGARYAVACSSGTGALHLANIALGFSKGDRVITTPITFLATANSIRYTGADVVFADISQNDVNLHPDRLREVVEDNTRTKPVGIIPVHFAGHPANMEEIWNIAENSGMAVIEDACHALGASYTTTTGEVVKVGSCRHSDLTVFSFHPVKHIATGEGGAVTTNDRALYEKLCMLRNHGMLKEPARFENEELALDHSTNSLDFVNPWYYEMHDVGYNYRISDFQCALGSSQLSRIEEFLTVRRGIAESYRTKLNARVNDFVKVFKVASGVTHAYHLFVVSIDFKSIGRSRADIVECLRRKGIGTQVHYIPLHLQPYYRNTYGYTLGDFPVAEKYYEQCLSLPMYPSMPDDGVERVVDAFEETINRN